MVVEIVPEPRRRQSKVIVPLVEDDALVIEIMGPPQNRVQQQFAGTDFYAYVKVQCEMVSLVFVVVARLGL
jgi:hypothetical protein